MTLDNRFSGLDARALQSGLRRFAKMWQVFRKRRRGEEVGEESATSESDSTDTSNWSELERVKLNADKKKRLKNKRKELERKCAHKASNMIGIGPICMRDVTELMEEGLHFEEAKIAAFKDFLNINLGYIDSELDSMEIKETKFTKNEDILYVAILNHGGCEGNSHQEGRKTK